MWYYRGSIQENNNKEISQMELLWVLFSKENLKNMY
jgi:hypothetical protein